MDCDQVRFTARHAFAASSLPSPSLLSSSSSSTHIPPHPPPSSFPALAMGQSESVVRAHSHALLPTVAPQPILPAQQPASRLKFSWPGRRKKSEDFGKSLPTTSPLPSPPASLASKGKAKDLARQDSFASQADGDFLELARPASRSSTRSLTFQFASSTLQAFKGKLNASQSSVHSFHSSATPPSLPPPLPPKSDHIRLSSSSLSSSQGRPSIDRDHLIRGKPLPQTSVPAANSMEVESPPEPIPVAMEDDVKIPQRRECREHGQSAKEIVDDWRKSDSTLRTVRLVGSRTPRPLSLAESTNSGHTVLPAAGSPSANIGANRRLSALMTDVDFGMPEVDSEDDEDDDDSVLVSGPSAVSSSMHDLVHTRPHPLASSTASSRSSSPASQNQPGPRRGSLSIRIGSRSAPSDHLSGSDSEALSSSFSTNGIRTPNSSTTSVTSSPSAKDSSVLEARPSVEIVSTSSVDSDMSDMHLHQFQQYEGRKPEPWVSAHKASDSQTSLSTSTSSHMSREAPLNPLSQSHGPSIRPAHQRTRLQSIQSRGFRQTAVSLTTGLAPAAGFAKKAVDKLGRALGGSAASLGSSTDYYTHVPPPSAMPAGHGPSATSTSFFGMMARTGTEQQYPHHQHGHARQRQAHGHGSGQAVGNGQQQHASKKALRKHAPNAPSGTWSIGSNSTSISDTDGSAGQGPNLGRRVRAPLHTGLVFGRDLALCVRDTAVGDGIGEETEMLSLKGRLLPALVTRCAQHIVKWGVQEEGLFRISGRSTHVSKLRTEFDSGADYDMRECGPGEIDPHAVSSIFKAYLRELPEPLLTRNLMPYFEAALSAENSMVNAADAQSGGGNSFGDTRGFGFGLPSSPRGGMQVRKAPSLSTFAVPTLAPRAGENRDLLRTVAELIRATARCSKETKMPLSNLLLVPPLLRVLCEGEGIWDGPPKAVRGPVIAGDMVLDIAEDVDAPQKGSEDEERNADEEGESGLRAQRTIKRAVRTSHDLSEVDKVVIAVPATTLSSLALPDDGPDTPSDIPSSAGHSKTDSLLSAPSSESLSTPPSSGRTCRRLPRQTYATGKARPSHRLSSPATSASRPTPARARRRCRASCRSARYRRSWASRSSSSSRVRPQSPMSALEPVPHIVRVRTPCPVLDLPVDTSPILLGLGLGNVPLTEEPESGVLAPSPRLPSPGAGPSPRPQGTVMSRAASDSSALTSSVRALAPAVSLATASSTSSSGSYSFLDFNVSKEPEEDDWAKSVLQAAAQ
ncbi:hypothetical protein DFH11DRAFT_1563702 [Phellopilus nigrolimitatus]|nr:hypothetical protein DFH11DRAFT_1563702 [Phellopilus nigrolimitatus]